MAEGESGSIAFALESIDSAWDEAIPLIARNHAETGALSREDFSPDRVAYEALEDSGRLRVFTARKDGRIVGYAVFAILRGHPDYPGLVIAAQRAMYVEPSLGLARGRTSARFIQWQDEQLASEGIHVVSRDSTRRNPYGRLLGLVGYAEDEVRYIRDLRVQSVEAHHMAENDAEIIKTPSGAVVVDGGC